MNANRMKYASTPTYGLQKRGLFGKRTAPQQSAGQPDFSRPPVQPNSLPPSAFFSVPSQSADYGAPPYQGANPSPYFPRGMSVPPIQNIPSNVPFSYPTSGYGVPPQAYAPQGYPQQAAAPYFAQPGQSAMPPLGNNIPPVQRPNVGFSTRSQGFVPPQAASGMTPGVQAAPPVGAPQQPAAMQQPAPYLSGSPLPNAPLYAGGVSNMGPQVRAFEPQQPYFAQTSTVPFQPPMGGVSPSQGYAGAPARPKGQAPMDVNKLWNVFLFGLLPLLFIPCVFVPQSLNFLRYLFLTLCVCGMGGMWYRQMYSSAIRVAVSVVYVALCIITVSMLMQGGRDIQQTSARAPLVQETVAPSSEPAAVAATAEIVVTPEPTTASKSDAQMRLETFMSNWSGNRVEDMVGLVQPSWATKQESPSKQLFQLLANRTPIEFTIEDISGTDEDTSRTVTMTASIDKNNGKDPALYRFMVLMVKEGGEWYVDPASLATNDEIKTEEVVVNDRQSTGAATAAPRTTVSPAPAGSTVLYYNPDGGHYYHMDANCESIKAEYRPLQGSFLYSELSQHLKDLQPCLKCGAPTSALPDSQ